MLVTCESPALQMIFPSAACCSKTMRENLLILRSFEPQKSRTYILRRQIRR